MALKAKDQTASYAKWMMHLTWIIALALASFFFQKAIDNKKNPNQFLSNDKNTPLVLKQNSKAHYLAYGEINGYRVTFLLDTGATNVTISEGIAQQLNLTKQGSALVSTANGNIQVHKTLLDTLKLGNITSTNVVAYINPYNEGDIVLLGMSFLKHLSLVQKNNTLTLSTDN